MTNQIQHREPAHSYMETTASVFSPDTAYTAASSGGLPVVYELDMMVVLEPPLAGSVKFFIDPDKPVGIEDWDMLKE